MIEVLDAPLPATFQDGGRPGYRHLGVPLSGALDVDRLAIANALAGNPPTTVALEIRLRGPRLRALQPVILALAGEFSARIEDSSGQSRAAGNWRSLALAKDEVLDTGFLKSGIGYLAAPGGFDLPPVLGSRSTYARAEFGGIDGRCIKVGDRLKVVGGEMPILLRLPQPPRLPEGPLRVIAGPQREYFTDATWAAFVASEFIVSRAADRMGLRLDGPRLEHTHGA
ncbi:MAG: biotin-dependent carboxyltransferase family protein, partial [Betaproteobacteria bacterium]|nr:biotin-dependent carboxyltransferase family protein [Betaproteobacteria bacterium]